MILRRRLFLCVWVASYSLATLTWLAPEAYKLINVSREIERNSLLGPPDFALTVWLLKSSSNFYFVSNGTNESACVLIDYKSYWGAWCE